MKKKREKEKWTTHKVDATWILKSQVSAERMQLNGIRWIGNWVLLWWILDD